MLLGYLGRSYELLTPDPNIKKNTIRKKFVAGKRRLGEDEISILAPQSTLRRTIVF